MQFSLILDIIIAVLLAATIGYAFTLNRRLGELRKDRAELEELTQKFSDATERAEASIRKLSVSADEVASSLRDSLSKAEAARDDLVFLIERAGESADKIEDRVRKQRTEAPAKARTIKDSVVDKPRQQAKTLQDDDEDEEFTPKTDAERELLKALQSVR